MKGALNTPILTLQLLFVTAKGSAALVAFLEKNKDCYSYLAASSRSSLRALGRPQQNCKQKSEETRGSNAILVNKPAGLTA
jgi:hypothetical protein